MNACNLMHKYKHSCAFVCDNPERKDSKTSISETTEVECLCVLVKKGKTNPFVADIPEW